MFAGGLLLEQSKQKEYNSHVQRLNLILILIAEDINLQKQTAEAAG